MNNIEFLKKYSAQCIITFSLAIVTWLLLMYAEAYAQYLADIYNYIDSSSLKYFFTKFTRFRVSAFDLIYFIPFAVIVFSREVPWLRNAWFFIAFMLAVFAALSIGSGGDRKGCTACLGLAYFYLLVLPIPAIISVVYSLFRWILPTKHVTK